MSNQPKVTFIICTYNRAQYLNDTLGSLLHRDYSSDLPFELLVIDNNSTDETKEVVQQHKKSTDKDGKAIRYIKEPNQGLSHARNRGILEAEAPYVVFFDDDIRATHSLIPSWISFFNAYPDAKTAGGKIHVQFDAPRPPWMSYFLLPLLGYHDLGDSIKKYPNNKYPFGGNMGFKKSVFDQIGVFDTALGRKGESLNAGEEKELFRRIRSASMEIYYLPDAFLYHRVDSSRLTVNYIRNQAIGLGQSMKLRMADASVVQFIGNWVQEIGKLFASVPLGIYYLTTLNLSKATMLFKFRWWIWKGYRTSDR